MTNPKAPPNQQATLVVDTPSLYYRAFYALPTSLTAPDGTPVNAVRGLLDMLATLIDANNTPSVLACWDNDWRPEFRTELMPSYKAQRVGPGGGEETPDELSAQLDLIRTALRHAQIPILGVDGYEADDVIASVVAQNGQPSLVVTGDRDLFQLLDETDRVQVVYPGKSIKDAKRMTNATLAEQYGVESGEQYAAMATLRGDPSDGLPGVAGVGEKTAVKLIRTFGTVAGVIAAARSGDRSGGLSDRIAAAVIDGAEQLARAEQVVNTVRNLDLGVTADELPGYGLFTTADADQASAWAEDWGVASSLGRLLAARERVATAAAGDR
ncbi:5'-3' exonuclease [Saxibacter everestensis]|uniref:5'-3' exonuclease n=1 Tax=Saxibacter everestensis TaxID=2909229 RepID=A0ABY8QXB4_9MICO|nr:5'-3' exonuclease [Brevibacteriaceae bacterium ZFBP1038]